MSSLITLLADSLLLVMTFDTDAIFSDPSFVCLLYYHNTEPYKPKNETEQNLDCSKALKEVISSMLPAE